VAARKPWAELSDTYRARLLKGGVNEAQHTAGATLHKARGKISAPHEAYQKQLNRFVKEYRLLYGNIEEPFGSDGQYPAVPSGPDFRAAFAHLSTTGGLDAIRRQRRMERYYDQGKIREAQALWNTRPADYPEWMFYYHGAFS
jgi:hypothetical protein